jgi:hypothetical protein
MDKENLSNDNLHKNTEEEEDVVDLVEAQTSILPSIDSCKQINRNVQP